MKKILSFLIVLSLLIPSFLFAVTQTSFNAGELSEQIYGRPRLEKYANGVKELYNFTALPHGPASRRDGTEFIARVKDHSKEVRLYGYEYSKVQAYILEWGNNYIRFYKDGGQIIEKTATVTGASKTNPVVITATNTFVNGEVVRISGVLGMTELNEQEYTVANVSGADFELSGINGIGFTTYISGGISDKPFQVTTTYIESELFDIDLASINDVIYIAHSDHAPATLTRSGDTSWALADISFTAEPAEWGANDFPSTLTFDNERLWWASSPSFPMRLWGSKVGIYNDHGVSSPLVADDALNLDIAAKQANAIQWIDSTRKFIVGTTGSEYWLTSSSGDGPITALSKQAVPGSFNGTSDVFPEPIGGTLLYLQRQNKVLRELIHSFTADRLEGEDLTVLAEHLTRTNTITQLSFQREPYKILWCVRDDGFLLGLTYYPEHEVFGWHRHEIGGDGIVESVASIPGSTQDEVWLSIKRTIDSSEVRYIEKIHDIFKGDDTLDAFYVDSGLSLDNRLDIESIDHTDPGIVNFTGHPYSNGDVVTFRSIDLDISGEEDFQTLNGETLTVANAAANTFELTDGGTPVSFVEYKQIESATSALNQTVLTGLAHLEGEELTILADGAPVAEKTVENSQITLDSGASVVHAGLFYFSQIRTLPPYVQNQGGDNFAENMRITNIIVQLYKTLGMKTGPNEDNLSDYDFISDQVPLGLAGDLFDGFTHDISFDGEYSRDPSVYIRQDQPLPLTVLSLTMDFEGE